MKRFRVYDTENDTAKVITVSESEMMDEKNLGFLQDDTTIKFIAMVKAMGGDSIVEFVLDMDNEGASEKNIETFINEWKEYVAEVNDEEKFTYEANLSADFEETGLCDDLDMEFEDRGLEIEEI